MASMDTVYATVPHSWLTTNPDEPFAEFYGKISQKEYIDDFQTPARESTETIPAWLQIVGTIVLMICLNVLSALIILPCALYQANKAQKRLSAVCDAFSAKYQKSRGVSVELTETSKFKVTVKQPGVPIPGVEFFTPCRESAVVIRSYATGNLPPSASAAAAPNAFGVTPDAGVTFNDDPTTPLLAV